MGISENVTGSLRAQEHGHQPIVYGISAYESNAMKSSNPHSGIYQAETARTIDLNGGSPACNQGGMAVVCATTEMTPKTDEDGVSFSLRSRDYKDPQVVCIEGNGSRPSHKGDGYAESETMYTRNSTEHHAVCAEPIPINTMVGTRTTDENRTTFGIGSSGDPQFTLSSAHSHAVAVENHPADSRVKISEDGMVQTLSGRMGTGGGNVPMVMEQQVFSEVAACLNAQDGRGGVHSQKMADPEGNFVLEPVCIGNGQAHIANHLTEGVSQTLNCMHDPMPVMTYGLDRASFNQGKNAKYDFSIEEEKIGAQVARGPGAVCNSVVRRLTPLECERLQGFPDHYTDIGDWTDSKGKKHKGDSDSPRYKALGNSIALPFWQWMVERMMKVLNVEEPTMASLFDGIGGFPLVFKRCGCIPVWASEIEEFPIAVTKIRFPEYD